MLVVANRGWDGALLVMGRPAGDDRPDVSLVMVVSTSCSADAPPLPGGGRARQTEAYPFRRGQAKQTKADPFSGVGKMDYFLSWTWLERESPLWVAFGGPWALS